MNQLHQGKSNLLEMGFESRVCKGKIFYISRTLNGYFYYNPRENVWYHRTIIGAQSDHIFNDVILDITSKTELLILLKTFMAASEEDNFNCNKCDTEKEMTQVAVKHSGGDFECVDCYADSMQT